MGGSMGFWGGWGGGKGFFTKKMTRRWEKIGFCGHDLEEPQDPWERSLWWSWICVEGLDLAVDPQKILLG